MNKLNLKTMILIAVLGIFGKLNAQDFSDLKHSIKFWTGSGADSGAVIVTFPGNGFSDSSYIWGVLFDDSISGGDALQNIANADVNFDFEAQGGFLDSVSYNNFAGKNGIDNFWWNTFSFENGDWAFNSGLATNIHKNEVFGMSYTDSDPVTYEPYRLPTAKPAPALNPNAITIADFDNNDWRWFGEGSSKALLVIDFDPANGGKSFAFGVKFDDSATGLEILQAVAAEDTMLKINASGFLNDIIYDLDSGMGGTPNYWATWSATNFGNWNSNMGISAKVFDGGFFGCTYTDFSPALRPDYPQVIEAPEGVEDDNTSVYFTDKNFSMDIYPNPFVNTITFESDENVSIDIFTIEGKLITSTNVFGKAEISTADWNTGVYFVIAKSQNGSSVQRIIKE